MYSQADTLRLGIDVGSTTLKIIILDRNDKVIFSSYKRHKAEINKLLSEELSKVARSFPDSFFYISVTGSAGMGISERTGIPFVQEVIASVSVVKKVYPQTRTLIDLGGEDAKMVFFSDQRHPDIRMNGSCAGGTGAFIDQMADLMNIPVEQLGQEAMKHKKIYPVASRCGVFAKTDVQNLISRGVPVPDISMSILRTVALQSVTSLARGHEIIPKALCVGGPLTFIPALRKAFAEVLNLNEDDIILPENSEFFPAWGAALKSESTDPVSYESSELINFKFNAPENLIDRKDVLDPLFNNENEYEEWKNNRNLKPLKLVKIKDDEKELDCFLGIDSGSTTTKIVITDQTGRLLYFFYDKNEGNPLAKAIEGLNKFFIEHQETGIKYRFRSTAATGYGEDLIKSALGLDYGIVETIAHLSGARYIDPEVSFILDIGGQDIKSIFTRNGVISNIELNEACSSGCGSFLQNFASTMNMSLLQFSEAACLAASPSDLGTRCTVFMNSKVKQSLRENADIGDISAGLAYSVVKNCLFKVLKISNLNQLGDNIVVQGGTFKNNAVYRALEVLSGKKVSSTDHPELMGAFGAALYACQRWKQEKFQTGFCGKENLPDPGSVNTKELRCKGCTNKCTVLRFRFENGNICYSGNKCEKVFFSNLSAPVKGYNGFENKNEVIFSDATLIKTERDLSGKSENILKTVIGIPRVLNMFENYPFWETMFRECGFEVILSSESTFDLYQRGIGSVMSDNICFPAKLVHGHILDLIDKKVDRIFYPMVTKEIKEFKSSANSYNCPVVSGYPDVVRSSMEPLEKYGVPLDKPVVTFNDHKVLERSCVAYFSSLDVDENVVKKAVKKALLIRDKKRKTLAQQQRSLFNETVAKGEMAFVVAGRPYHADPLVNQKVGQVLSDLGVHVFTDDIFREEDSSGFGPLKIVSQWSYPNRVVQAAIEVAKLPENVQFIQLNSFGCGPDSFFMDETREILQKAGKNHTLLRIDEIASPGSIRLRLRSLIESLKVANNQLTLKNAGITVSHNASFTKKDRKKTILAPWFSDFISPFIPVLGELAGYHIVNLPRSSKTSADAGLKYGHNEVCYPSTLVLGDLISALQTGEYDLENTAVAITQTGGQCRATNYIAQIKNGLENAGFTNVPVIVLSSGKVYQNDQKGFKVPLLKLLNITVHGLLYADALQQMYSSMSVRESTKGESLRLFDLYINSGIDAVRKRDCVKLVKLLSEAVWEFNKVGINEKEYRKVGLIGEIYVKYNSYGQAHTTEWLRSHGMDVVTPPIIDFLMQYFVNSKVNIDNGVTNDTLLSRFTRPLFWKYMNERINKFEKVMKDFRYYQPSESIFTKSEYASEILDLSNQFGEGWMLAAEVAHYARQGVTKIVCVQPFGCIANHIVAKGVEKRLKKFYPEVDMLYLDIDGGMAEVNLQNRLQFLMQSS